jgi:glyoxylase-like metal-dependent hydrolase (beta-lactamase superfamily II)
MRPVSGEPFVGCAGVAARGKKMTTMNSTARRGAAGGRLLAFALFAACLWPTAGFARGEALPGAPGAPYAQMPEIAAIGERVDRRLPIPDSARGPAIDPAKGYRLENLGGGLYMITDNIYQSMFLVYERGVVVVDAPPNYAAHIRQAIAEVTNRPITHLIYSHAHIDHIGGAAAIGGHPIIIAHTQTARILARAHDPNRPAPTVTFEHAYNLQVGSRRLELSYHGVAHEAGNIFIYAPAQRTLMVVDVVFPGWMPWRRFALAQDVPGYFAQVEEISHSPFEHLIGGHVARIGTHADVDVQLEFMNDVKAAAATALGSTTPGDGVNAADRANPWGIYDDYIDRVAAQCVNALTPKWRSRLAAYDVFVWDQCYAMEQSLRIDGANASAALD